MFITQADKTPRRRRLSLTLEFQALQPQAKASPTLQIKEAAGEPSILNRIKRINPLAPSIAPALLHKPLSKEVVRMDSHGTIQKSLENRLLLLELLRRLFASSQKPL